MAFDIPSLFFGVSFLFLIRLLFLIYPDVTLVNFHECVLTAAFFSDDSSYTACTGVQRYFCIVEVGPGISHDSKPPV